MVTVNDPTVTKGQALPYHWSIIGLDNTNHCYNRVVHSCHFPFIFNSFCHHFPFHFDSIFLKSESENEEKMNVKWNPTLTFAKRRLKNDHFSSFWQCAWWAKCIFASFFLISLPRVFTVTIFHIIFHFIFGSLLCFHLPNTQKWAKNEFENEPKMSQEWLLWTSLMM